MRLTLENCSLLERQQSHLLNFFNLVYSIANCEDERLRRHFRLNAEFSSKDGGSRSLDETLQEIAATLKRDRYSIGFVGPFQVGKTSAVNRVMAVRLLAEGGTGACTSIATVVELQQSPSAEPEFSVRYFSRQQLQRRFSGVARRGESPCPVISLPERGSVDFNTLKKWATQLQSSDSDFLLRLVTQYHQAPENLLDSQSSWFPCRDSKELEQRLDRLVQYRGDVAPNSDVQFPLLVREVVVRIYSPNVPKGLELVDLPGLGTIHSYDTELTKAYVRELDGLLLFSESGKTENENLPELLEELKRSRSSLAGRVYRIVTKVDQSGKENLYGGSYFTKLSANNAKLAINDLQVRFLCQKSKYRGALVDLDEIPRAEWKDALCIKEQDGQVVVPSSEQAFGLFENAFLMYAGDGGSEAIQNLIRFEIRNTVRDAVCSEAHEQLKKVASKLTHCIQLALQGGISQKEREVARALSSELLKCAEFLRPGAIDLSDTAAAGFFQQCWKSLRKHITPESVQAAQQRDRESQAGGKPFQSRWVQLHQNFAAEILDACRKRLPQVAEDIFEKLISRLQAFVNDSEDLVQLMKENSVTQISGLFPTNMDPLQKLHDASRRATDSLSQLSSAVGQDPLVTATLNDIQQLGSLEMIRDDRTEKLFLEYTPDMYVTVMRRKVEAFAYQQVARLRLVVKAASVSLEDELNDMANSREDLAGELKESQRAFLEASLGNLRVE